MSKLGLTRNANAILNNLKELPNGSVITTKACKIQIPTRFGERNLAEIGVDIFIPGIYAIIMDNMYAVSLVNAQIKIAPAKILKKLIEDVEYYEFFFEPGQVMFKSTTLVQKDTLLYYVFDEIITKANIPWFLNYDDLGKLLDSSYHYTGKNIANNQELTELIISLISRDPDDRIKYYRTAVKSYADLDTTPPTYVPLNSVIYSATNTLNKLAGNYINDGIISALVNPTERTERLDSLLRQ